MPKKHCRGSASILFLYSWSRIVEYRKIIYSEKIGSIPSYRSHHFSSSYYKLFLYYIEEKGLEAFYSCHKSFYIIVYGIHHIVVGIGSFNKLYLLLIHVYVVAVQPAGLISVLCIRALCPSIARATWTFFCPPFSAVEMRWRSSFSKVRYFDL